MFIKLTGNKGVPIRLKIDNIEHYRKELDSKGGGTLITTSGYVKTVHVNESVDYIDEYITRYIIARVSGKTL